MRQISRILAAGMLVTGLGAQTADAAKAPLSQKELKKQASEIITGQVISVKSKTQKSMFEKDFGIHRDTVFRIKVKVVKVSKGKGIKPDEEILIEAWKPALRLPPLAGLQGHNSIPKKGDEITVFLRRKKDKVREPLLPNGIEIKKPSKKPNPKTVCPMAASAAK